MYFWWFSIIISPIKEQKTDYTFNVSRVCWSIWEMDHRAIDTQLVYLQEYLPMTADHPGLQWLVTTLRQPSRISDQKWLARESLWIQLPPWTVSLAQKQPLVLKNVVISTGFGWGAWWSPMALGSGSARTTSHSRDMLMVDFWHLSNGGARASTGCHRFGSGVWAMTV